MQDTNSFPIRMGNITNQIIFFTAQPVLYLLLMFYLYNRYQFLFVLSVIYLILVLFLTLFISLPYNGSTNIIKVESFHRFLFSYWYWFNTPLFMLLKIPFT